MSNKAKDLAKLFRRWDEAIPGSATEAEDAARLFAAVVAAIKALTARVAAIEQASAAEVESMRAGLTGSAPLVPSPASVHVPPGGEAEIRCSPKRCADCAHLDRTRAYDDAGIVGACDEPATCRRGVGPFRFAGDVCGIGKWKPREVAT